MKLKKLGLEDLSFGLIVPGADKKEIEKMFPRPSQKEAVLYNAFVNALSRERGNGERYKFEESPYAKNVQAASLELNEFEQKVLKEAMLAKSLNPDNMEISKVEFYVCPCCPFGVDVDFRDKKSEERFGLQIVYRDIFPVRDLFKAIESYAGRSGIWGINRREEKQNKR